MHGAHLVKQMQLCHAPDKQMQLCHAPDKQMQHCHAPDKQVLHYVLTSLHAMCVVVHSLCHRNPVPVRAVVCSLRHDMFNIIADNIDTHT